MTPEEWAEAERRYERQLVDQAVEDAEFDQWVVDQMYQDAERERVGYDASEAGPDEPAGVA